MLKFPVSIVVQGVRHKDIRANIRDLLMSQAFEKGAEQSENMPVQDGIVLKQQMKSTIIWGLTDNCLQT